MNEDNSASFEASHARTQVTCTSYPDSDTGILQTQDTVVHVPANAISATSFLACPGSSSCDPIVTLSLADYLTLLGSPTTGATVAAMGGSISWRANDTTQVIVGWWQAR